MVSQRHGNRIPLPPSPFDRMSLFDLFNKKPAAPPTSEFKRAQTELKAAVADVRRAQEQMGDGWDVVDDARVEAEAKALTAEATQKAHAEAARQEGERLRRINALRAAERQERDRIARQARVERLVVTAASALKAHTLMSSARWETFLKEHRQAHDRLDELIAKACCWRCGQFDRLPVEDATLFRRPALPDRPGGPADDNVIAASRRLVAARKEALETWRRYNDRRLETEKLRLDANYHPALADRFTIQRHCEVCGSFGMFHAAHFSGNYAQTGVFSMESRWKSKMTDFLVWVPGVVFGGDWIRVEKLTRDQAKAWLQASDRSEPVHEKSLKDMAAQKEWDELFAANRLKATNRDSPYWWGREFQTHYYTKNEEHIYISKPNVSPRAQTCNWPEDRNWTSSASHPTRWKGGALNDLYVKPGVIYAPQMQDPMSKVPRYQPARPPIDEAPTEARLQFRTMFWIGAL